jgi:acetylornithine deacetylase/succinyl-diaminopimelate desuccinylase-like protein
MSDVTRPSGAAADALGVDPVELLTALIAAPSPNPPGDERAVAGVITDALKALGLPPPLVISKSPERPNMLVRIDGTGPRIMLAGHLDTMPAGNLASWQTPPFELVRSDGRLAGLGVADMKSGIVAALIAAARLIRDPAWTGSLDLLLVSDEENCSDYGMKWLAAQGVLTADAAVILEPGGGADFRSWDRLFVAQRGSAVLDLVANGTPGHSAAQISAEDRAGIALARAMTALADAHLFADISHPVDGTTPTVNIGTMVGGGLTPFMHPETLTATVEIRVIEGMTMHDVHAAVRTVIVQAGLGGRVDVLGADAPLDWVPPSPVVTDRRLLDAASTAWRAVLGTEPTAGVLLGVTDSSWLSLAGIPTLPALGCGSLAVAHQPNEWIAESDLPLAIDLAEALARAYAHPAESPSAHDPAGTGGNAAASLSMRLR